MGRDQLVEQLNAPSARRRLAALRKLKKLERGTDSDLPLARENDSNLHIHTIYSYSPYSPAQAAYLAYRGGIASAGIMDHDTLSGAREFVRACDILGIPHTVGFDFRVRLKPDRNADYPLKSDGYTYIAVYGIPKKEIKKVNTWLAEDRSGRVSRNRKFCEAVNKFFAPEGIAVDFDADVLPLTRCREGGSVTERHILRAVALKICEKFERGAPARDFLARLRFSLEGNLSDLLADADNPFYVDDLVTALKDNACFFDVGSRREAVDMPDVVSRLENFGAIVSYMFFGNLDELVAGETAEDKLEKLVLGVKELGFNALTVKVSRMEREDLRILLALCDRHAVLLLPGTAVNAPRQSFQSDVLAEEDFKGLGDASWAVVGHGKMSDCNLADGMFSQKAKQRCPNLSDRVLLYAEIGRKIK